MQIMHTGYSNLTPNSRYCYMVLKQPMSFADASKKCKEKGFGELASITSNALQDVLDSERKKNGVKYMWIGLKKHFLTGLTGKMTFWDIFWRDSLIFFISYVTNT